VRRLGRFLWAFLDHLGRAWLGWSLGASFVITALMGWGISVLDVIPSVFLVLLLIGLFFLSFASIGLAAPHLLARIPPPSRPRGEVSAGGASEERRGAALQKVRLIRNEIDTGTRVVQRAIGTPQVDELVDDVYWIGHRNELAGIPEAGDAHRLAGYAWEGFYRYNNAVKARTFISNDDLEAIVRDGQRASTALGVAANALR
jgi:hypothetical protein